MGGELERGGERLLAAQKGAAALGALNVVDRSRYGDDDEKEKEKEEEEEGGAVWATGSRAPYSLLAYLIGRFLAELPLQIVIPGKSSPS